MNFSNKFKIVWWVILLFILTIGCGWRLYINSLTSIDILIYIFWFILVLFPIISEVSIFGINVKKDIENAKNELKSFISQVSNNNYTHVHINSSQANQNEYRKKVEQDTQDSYKKLPDDPSKSFSISHNNEPDKKVKNLEKTTERVNKILNIEKLVTNYFIDKYSDNYKTQIKFEDSITNDNTIVDGLIFEEGKISRIVEIKYISEKSFDRIHYIIAGFIQNLAKFGLRIPVLFVIVSENIDTISAVSMNNRLQKINGNKKLNPGLISVSLIFFKLEDQKIIKINI